MADFPGLELIQDDLKRVEEYMMQESRSEVNLIIAACDHVFGSGGKRIRPALLLLCARLCGYQGEAAVAYSAAVEFAHTATLMHDDVVDQAGERRGKPSANSIFGNQVSVLVGDYLVFKGFNIMLRHKDQRIMTLINEIAIRMAEGEVFQLAQLNNPRLSEDDYFKIITNKTALLFVASCRIGAMLAHSDPDKENALAEYGRKLGLGFQLVDDVQDYRHESRRWGKKKGQDFLEGKMTLPLVRALQKSRGEDKEWIKKVMKAKERGNADLERIIKIIERSGAFESTMETARELGVSAEKDLDAFSDSQIRRALANLARLSVSRII